MIFARLTIVLLFILSVAVAAAEPIEIRVAHFIPDESPLSERVFGEMVDTLNRESAGKLRATHHPGGQLERSPGRYLDRLQQGDIDIALLVPAYTPEIFPDHGLLTLPTLFESLEHAQNAHDKLARRGLLRGYDQLHILAAFVADPYQLHLNFPYTGLESIKGKRIRTTHGIQERIVHALQGESIPGSTVVDVTAMLSESTVDGAFLPWTAASAFGVIDATQSHVQVEVGYPGLIIAMNQTKYQSLSDEMKQIVDRVSGAWILERTLQIYQKLPGAIAKQAIANSEHTVFTPTVADTESLKQLLEPIVKDWAEVHHNGELLVREVRGL